MKNLLNVKNLNFLVIFFIIFLFDRLSKFYILNLAESGEVDIYINTYINFYLITCNFDGFMLKVNTFL